MGEVNYPDQSITVDQLMQEIKDFALMSDDINPVKYCKLLGSIKLRIEQHAAQQCADLQAQLAQARSESAIALKWLCDVRFALGDNGKRMLPELVEFAKSLVSEIESQSKAYGLLHAERELLSVALNNCQIALVKSEQDATDRWREGVQYIANKICGEIPEGYVITLELEKDSASVGLFDWLNEKNIELPEQDEPYVHKWLTEALDAAKSSSGQGG